MNTGQMLMVMVAIVLFSSLFVNSITNISEQNEIIYKGTYILQGHKIAERYFEKIEAELLGEISSFGEVLDNYADYDTTFTVQNVDYQVSIVSNLCDANGNITDPQEDFQRVDIRINCNYGDDVLHIGTETNPLSKIFADLSM
ncbi:MAG TPA: hypothetical protein DHM37_01025 [Candidatus Cloacimonas sp.]|jgi:hypothetical protein|nr:hypothetical protein [Candidatus Cloacimonadota bacterium]HCX72278.1 hypothetical protein [Candidatus Cloacimonas sp.]